MNKVYISILITLINYVSYTSADYSIGASQVGEELILTAIKYVPTRPQRTNITHTFEFTGKDANIDRLTFIRGILDWVKLHC